MRLKILANSLIEGPYIYLKSKDLIVELNHKYSGRHDSCIFVFKQEYSLERANLWDHSKDIIYKIKLPSVRNYFILGKNKYIALDCNLIY